MFRILVYTLVLCLFIERSVAQFGCPSPITCNFSVVYSRLDGQCNNINNPLWGSTGRIFKRLLPAVYDDGNGSPRGSSGSPNLPTPRKVTATMVASETSRNSTTLSLMVMLLGQFIAHDISHTPDFTLEIDCCTPGFKFLADPHPQCLPLDVRDDPFYGQFPEGVECLSLARSKAASSLCGFQKREQVSLHTAWLDLSQVYGNSEIESNNLRTFQDGQLKIDENVENPPGRSCLPVRVNVCPVSQLPLDTCNGVDKLVSGDPARVDENPALVSIHAVFNRMHNDFAMTFSENGLPDDIAFQEARRCSYAVYQHFIYKEYLPTVLDPATIAQFKLSDDDPHVYNPMLDTTVPNVFATAAFRFGHTQIQNIFDLFDRHIHLKDSFFVPNISYQSGQHPTDFMDGVSSEVGADIDVFLVEAVTNFLRAKPRSKFGSDLFGRNTLRGREHGLPFYNEWREFCGLTKFTSFDDLTSVMKPSSVAAFRTIYQSVNDIDLYPAGLAELPKGGVGVGPTFSCIIAQQFHNAKYGDRFFYTSTAQPRPFDIDVLIEIKKLSLHSLICRYTNVDSVQKEVLKKQTGFGGNNPAYPCQDVLLSGSIVNLLDVILRKVIPALLQLLHLF